MSLSSHIGITCGEISCILKDLRYRSHHRYHCTSEIGNYGNGSKYKKGNSEKKDQNKQTTKTSCVNSLEPKDTGHTVDTLHWLNWNLEKC